MGKGERREGRREGEIGKLYASRPWFDLSAEDQAGGDDRTQENMNCAV